MSLTLGNNSQGNFPQELFQVVIVSVKPVCMPKEQMVKLSQETPLWGNVVHHTAATVQKKEAIPRCVSKPKQRAIC